MSQEKSKRIVKKFIISFYFIFLQRGIKGGGGGGRISKIHYGLREKGDEV